MFDHRVLCRERRTVDRRGTGSHVTPFVGLEVTPSIRLLRQLGSGGMGSVWKAHHAALQIDVAVKFLSPELQDSEGALQRFSDEAMVAAQVKSPHAVQVLDHGVLADELHFIVMELLEGEDLGSFVARRGPLNLADTATIVQQLGRVLRKAHAAGIVHRDVKPENVFLVGGDDELFVKLIDFGIAKWTTRGRALTATGTMVGTPDFMCPEQIASSKDVGPLADAWALAGVAYFSVVGRAPFARETIPGTFVAIEKGDFQPPFSRYGIGSRALDAFFNKAFCREPAGRFASVRELTAAFCDAAEVPLTRRLRLVTGAEDGQETWIDSSGVAVPAPKPAVSRAAPSQPDLPPVGGTRIGPIGSVVALRPLVGGPREAPPVACPPETVRGVTLESAAMPERVQTPPLLARRSVSIDRVHSPRHNVALALVAIASLALGAGLFGAGRFGAGLSGLAPSIARNYSAFVGVLGLSEASAGQSARLAEAGLDRTPEPATAQPAAASSSHRGTSLPRVEPELARVDVARDDVAPAAAVSAMYVPTAAEPPFVSRAAQTQGPRSVAVTGSDAAPARKAALEPPSPRLKDRGF